MKTSPSSPPFIDDIDTGLAAGLNVANSPSARSAMQDAITRARQHQGLLTCIVAGALAGGVFWLLVMRPRQLPQA